MTFTSGIFLIGLLPWFVILYKLLGNKKKGVREILLLVANAVFYMWSGFASFLFVCVFSVVIYLFTLLLSKVRKPVVLAIAVIVAVLPLLLVKDLKFVLENINHIVGWNISAPAILVPLGISFFTFESISLLGDVYWGKVEKAPNLLETYLYLTFFATVSSGPIVRFNEFKEGLEKKTLTCDYAAAVERIIIGLCKKILVADKIALLANYYFNGVAAGNSYSTLGLWLGSIAYTMELYFDFSGYSDMAIGIGQLLGFKIRENFNKPYQATSIKNFWGRWHMSLSLWFRDYIYIPLGGNRCSVPRHLFNMLVVWLLTGIWHGSDWSFIVWGLGYLVLLIIEKYVPFIKKIEASKFGHIYTLFFVNLLWVPFRADSLSTAFTYIKGMFGGGVGLMEETGLRFLPFLLFVVALCFPWDRLFARFAEKKWFSVTRKVLIIALAVLAICTVVNADYAPYIYGNF